VRKTVFLSLRKEWATGKLRSSSKMLCTNWSGAWQQCSILERTVIVRTKNSTKCWRGSPREQLLAECKGQASRDWFAWYLVSTGEE
jgi:hypothetical protein